MSKVEAAFRSATTRRFVMIHHRPQGFEDPLFRPSNVTCRATLDGSMVLALRLPFGRGGTDIAESSERDASIRIDGDGNVFVAIAGPGVGDDVCASVPKLIARKLEVPLSRVHLERDLPNGRPAPNRIAMIDNPETIQAALKLLGEAGAAARMMLTGAAAQRWDVSARSCHAHDGEVIHTHTWRKLGYGALAVDAAYRPIPREIELRGAAFR